MRSPVRFAAALNHQNIRVLKHFLSPGGASQYPVACSHCRIVATILANPYDMTNAMMAKSHLRKALLGKMARYVKSKETLVKHITALYRICVIQNS